MYKCIYVFHDRLSAPLWLPISWPLLDFGVPAWHQEQLPGPVSPVLPVRHGLNFSSDTHLDTKVVPLKARNGVIATIFLGINLPLRHVLGVQ